MPEICGKSQGDAKAKAQHDASTSGVAVARENDKGVKR